MRRFNNWLNATARVRRACGEVVGAGFRLAAEGTRTVVRPPPRVPADFPPAAGLVVADAYGQPDDRQRVFRLAEYLTYGHLDRGGVRCVAPTLGECEALARTDVTLPWADYRQPFPLVSVALPDGYPAAGPDLARPGAVLALHQPDGRAAVFVLVGDGSDPDRPLVSTFALPDPTDASAAGKWIDDPGRHADGLLDGEVAAMRSAVRLAMNACLLLATDGHRHLGKANPGHAERLRASLAKKALPAAVRAANRQALAELPDLYTFARPLPLVHTAGDTDPTGREVAAHWRRGHWANLACGSGRAERRLHFRPPVLVRPDRLPSGAAA